MTLADFVSKGVSLVKRDGRSLDSRNFVLSLKPYELRLSPDRFIVSEGGCSVLEVDVRNDSLDLCRLYRGGDWEQTIIAYSK